jgi:diaminohydroxyphosphoribosylaminopyrimidine deaminase/5-amino-6-(5-phosphoribosylamino)uracil reductase
VLQALFEHGIRRVWLEGGPTIAAAFLNAGLVDEVVAYLAPTLLGSGHPAVADLSIATLGNALRLQPSEFTTLGQDIRIRASINNHQPHRRDAACSLG